MYPELEVSKSEAFLMDFTAGKQRGGGPERK